MVSFLDIHDWYPFIFHFPFSFHIACLPAVTIFSSQINCAHFILNWSCNLLSLMHFCRHFTTSSRLILLFSLRYLHLIVPYSTSGYLCCVSLLSIEVFNAVGIVSHCGDWQSGLDHSTDGIDVRLRIIFFHYFNIQTLQTFHSIVADFMDMILLMINIICSMPLRILLRSTPKHALFCVHVMQLLSL